MLAALNTNGNQKDRRHKYNQGSLRQRERLQKFDTDPLNRKNKEYSLRKKRTEVDFAK